MVMKWSHSYLMELCILNPMSLLYFGGNIDVTNRRFYSSIMITVDKLKYRLKYSSISNDTFVEIAKQYIPPVHSWKWPCWVKHQTLVIVWHIPILGGCQNSRPLHLYGTVVEIARQHEIHSHCKCHRYPHHIDIVVFTVVFFVCAQINFICLAAFDHVFALPVVQASWRINSMDT